MGLWGPSYGNNTTSSLVETHIALDSVSPLPAEPSQSRSQRKGVAFNIWLLALPQCLLHFLLHFVFLCLRHSLAVEPRLPSEHIPNPPNSAS